MGYARANNSTTILDAINTTTTSSVQEYAFTKQDFDEIQLHIVITGTGTWNVKLQGCLEEGGTYVDHYRGCSGSIIQSATGNITSSMMICFKCLPPFFKIVATEVGGVSTLTLKTQLITKY